MICHPLGHLKLSVNNWALMFNNVLLFLKTVASPPDLLVSASSWDPASQASSSGRGLSSRTAHFIAFMALIAFMMQLYACQGESARLTSYAAAPAPTPWSLVQNFSLHRLHGPHRLHDAVVCLTGRSARLTSYAAAPAPTPWSLVQNFSLHRIHGPHRLHDAAVCLPGQECSVD